MNLRIWLINLSVNDHMDHSLRVSTAKGERFWLRFSLTGRIGGSSTNPIDKRWVNVRLGTPVILGFYYASVTLHQFYARNAVPFNSALRFAPLPFAAASLPLPSNNPGP